MYGFLWYVDWLLMRLCFRFRVVGAENVPKTGGVVLCANHISAFDPLAVAAGQKRPVHFMAKKEIFKGGIINAVLEKVLYAFPVDRQKNDMKAIKTAIQLLKGGDVVGIFAQGTRVGGDDAAAAKGGVALIAVKSNVPVVPVHIMGSYGFRKRVTVVFGQPISLEEYQGQRLNTALLTQIADRIMGQVLALGDRVALPDGEAGKE